VTEPTPVLALGQSLGEHLDGQTDGASSSKLVRGDFGQEVCELALPEVGTE